LQNQRESRRENRLAQSESGALKMAVISMPSIAISSGAEPVTFAATLRRTPTLIPIQAWRPTMANPSMNDGADKDIYTSDSATASPVPKSAEVATNPADDEKTSTPGNSFERGLDKDGNYRDAVDEMKKTLKDEGSYDAWKKGHTQN
jgi:hypothetical protein